METPVTTLTRPSFVARYAAMSQAQLLWVTDAIEPVGSPRPSTVLSGSTLSAPALAAAKAAVAATVGTHSKVHRRMHGLHFIRVSIRRRKMQRALRRGSLTQAVAKPDDTHRTKRVPPPPPPPPRDQLRLSNEPSFVSTANWSEATEACELDVDSPCQSIGHAATWKRLAGVRVRLHRQKKPKVMFSISFFPWKMEARGYYSTPEAAAEWVPDTASTRCQICLASFNLRRRRHHCRLCGHLICNECSLRRTFLPLSDNSRGKEKHLMVKSGEPQRTCNCCASTLRKMAAQHDHRVKQFSVEVVTATKRSRETYGMSSTCMKRKTTGQRAGSDPARSDATAENQLQILHSSLLTTAPAARNQELEKVLRARAQSRTMPTATEQFVICSRWLEQWMQYVHVDSSEYTDAEHHHQSAMPAMAQRRPSRHRNTISCCSELRPGPISNYTLLNFVSGQLVAKDDLRRSRGTDVVGDYHVVSHEVWLVFWRLYGGGPSIRLAEGSPYDSDNQALTVTNSNRATFESSQRKRWIITELDDFISCRSGADSEYLAPHSADDAPERQSAAVCFREQLGPRSTSSCTTIRTRHQKPSRAASTSTIRSIPAQPVMGKKRYQHDDSLRASSSFVDYWKRWRHSDDQQVNMTRSNTVTISQLSDEVMLFDPSQFDAENSHQTVDVSDDSDEGEADLINDTGHVNQIAAVSAFAQAAAEARRKSALSLLRHSSLASMHTTS